jgi:hypothetical protein
LTKGDWLAFRVEPIRPVDDKVGRVYQAKFEVGLVHFPKQAEFLPTLEAELLAFRIARPTTSIIQISHTNTLLITRTGSWALEALERNCAADLVASKAGYRLRHSRAAR